MWAVCDLAMVLLNTKSSTFEMKEFITEARIPTMYFKRQEDPMFVNSRHYLPPEMYQQASVVKKTISVNSNVSTNSNNTNNSNNANEKTSAPTATNSSATTNEKTVPPANAAGGRKLRGRKLENTNETDVQVSFPLFVLFLL